MTSSRGSDRTSGDAGCNGSSRERRQKRREDQGDVGASEARVEPGTFRALVQQLGDDVDRYGDLPVVLEPLPGGPRWRFTRAGLAGVAGDWDAVVVRGAELVAPVEDAVSVDACVEQMNRARAVGDFRVAAEWARRLTVLLAKAAGVESDRSRIGESRASSARDLDDLTARRKLFEGTE
ncbi:hypothetical protein [Amycolatopsis sp. NPDC051102]|uniref:hypothetical protein n=1 Tax=Amycolatopsis sp. NPDC051102 TaxID=3155163 RepID=UPI00343B6A1A